MNYSNGDEYGNSYCNNADNNGCSPNIPGFRVTLAVGVNSDIQHSIGLWMFSGVANCIVIVYLHPSLSESTYIYS